MNNGELIKEIARKSKCGENPLTVKQARECVELFQEIVKETVTNGETVRLENFLKIDIKELKSRPIKNVYTKQYDVTRDLKVPRVKLSLNFINQVKQNLNEDVSPNF